MYPRRWPGPPTDLDLVRFKLLKVEVPVQWEDYLPVSWRDYWTVELDPT
jgi:hypothetical protein